MGRGNGNTEHNKQLKYQESQRADLNTAKGNVKALN